MHLVQLSVQSFRNFTSLDLVANPHFNVIYGENGSGKTSLLEAIHFLGLGRSFRARHTRSLIQHHMPACAVFAWLENGGFRMGVGAEKQRQGKLIIKNNGTLASSVAEIATLLPIQVLNQTSFNLLDGGLKYRRQYLDWGVFHVEPGFHPLWKRLQRALVQRNAALRQNVPNEQIKLWDKELQAVGVAIAQMRQQYIERLLPLILDFTAKLLGDRYELSLQYSPGWEVQEALEDVLARDLAKDRVLGYTQRGPHRADWHLLVEQRYSIQDVLSRGEQKMMVCALKLAQASLLQQLTDKRGLFLLDDLPAELDKQHCQHVLQALRALNSQVFMTCIDVKAMPGLQEGDETLFHVEQGRLTAHQIASINV